MKLLLFLMRDHDLCILLLVLMMEWNEINTFAEWMFYPEWKKTNNEMNSFWRYKKRKAQIQLFPSRQVWYMKRRVKKGEKQMKNLLRLGSSRILLIFSLFECLEIQIACISKQQNCVLECVVSIISFLNSFDEWLRLSLLHSLNSRPDKKKNVKAYIVATLVLRSVVFLWNFFLYIYFSFCFFTRQLLAALIC